LDAVLDNDLFPGLNEDPSTANAAPEIVKASSESAIEEGGCLVVGPGLRESDFRVRALFFSFLVYFILFLKSHFARWAFGLCRASRIYISFLFPDGRRCCSANTLLIL